MDKQLFEGMTFIEPPVSLDEYVKHYDEYVQRCSQKELPTDSSSLSRQFHKQRIPDQYRNSLTGRVAFIEKVLKLR